MNGIITGIAAAIRAMFRLRPNTPAQEDMIRSIDEIRVVSETSARSSHSQHFEDAMIRISQELKR